MESSTAPTEPSIFARVRPAYQQVADQLLGAILRGDLGPGHRLPTEVELAKTFGVSRATVREALRSLASQDLIYSVRGAGGGTFIAETNFDRIEIYLETSLGLLSGSGALSTDELLDMREVLEIHAVRLAAARRTPEHLELLQRSIDEEKQDLQVATRLRLTQTFHETILDAAGSRLLGALTPPMVRLIHARFREGVPDKVPWPNLDGDHEEILARISDGDAAGAAKAMHDHLQRMWAAATGAPDTGGAHEHAGGYED
jgi:DNA-binding FadR family transcriptional regulator